MIIYLCVFLIILFAELDPNRDNMIFHFNNETYLTEIIEKINLLKSELEPIIINVFYNLMYYTSYLQIKINKLKNILAPHLEKLKKYLKPNTNDDTKIIKKYIKGLDKNGNIVNDIIVLDNYAIDIMRERFNEGTYTCLLCDKISDTNCINYVYYEKMPNTLDYVVSNVSFIRIELEHENITYTLNLKTPEYNYYIVNNCLNQTFFKYYLKNVLNVPINETNFNYMLTIIDNNVFIIYMTQDDYIIINENDYSVHSKNCPEINSNKSTNHIINNSVVDTFNVDDNEPNDSVKSNETNDSIESNKTDDDFIKIEKIN